MAFTLRKIAHADFRMNEANQLAKQRVRLKAGECILLISMTEKLLRFIFKPIELELPDQQTKPTVLKSILHRILNGGRWSPYMLKNYATEAGVSLEGLQTFEQHFERIRRAKKGE